MRITKMVHSMLTPSLQDPIRVSSLSPGSAFCVPSLSYPYSVNQNDRMVNTAVNAFSYPAVPIFQAWREGPVVFFHRIDGKGKVCARRPVSQHRGFGRGRPKTWTSGRFLKDNGGDRPRKRCAAIGTRFALDPAFSLVSPTWLLFPACGVPSRISSESRFADRPLADRTNHLFSAASVALW
jgi:hypothetical protein